MCLFPCMEHAATRDCTGRQLPTAREGPNVKNGTDVGVGLTTHVKDWVFAREFGFATRDATRRFDMAFLRTNEAGFYAEGTKVLEMRMDGSG